MKKTIQTFVLAALCLFLSIAARAQTAALKIGDKVPDITINNIINYKSSTAKLSDFKGKLLILDFWATWCGSCIKAMPKLDSLQAEFADRIQVISVTDQDKKIIDAFKLKNPVVRNFKIPMITGDKELSALFPHRMVPHLVWINPEGRLLNTTSGYDAESENIQKLLKGQLPNFKGTKTDDLGFDADKPLFENGNGKNPGYLYRSLITGYADGLPARSGSRKGTANFSLYATNVSLATLYCIALGLPQHTWKDKRITYEGSAMQYRISNYTEQKAKAIFCYELEVSTNRQQDSRKMMRDNLDRFFSLHAEVVNRETECLALIRINPEVLLKSGGEARKNNLSSAGKELKYMINQPLSFLSGYLNGMEGIPPVLDETGHTGNADLQLNNNLRNIPELNTALAKYGLRLETVRRKMDMLVIKGN